MGDKNWWERFTQDPITDLDFFVPDQRYIPNRGLPKTRMPVPKEKTGWLYDNTVRKAPPISGALAPKPVYTPQTQPGKQLYGLKGQTAGFGNAQPSKPQYASTYDPYAGLFQTVGTTGGSPGYDNRGNVAAYYQELRDRAGTRYGQAKMDLGEVYDQLAAMYEPMAAATAAAYGDAIAGGATESEALIAATQERINNEAAMTAAQFAEMGIDEAPMPSEAQAEAERGMSDIGANQAAWSGLMGAFSTAAQQRFQSDYLGAGETKAMAVADLVNQYQNYLNSLADQEAQAMQGAYAPGVAGTPQTLMDTLPTAVQTDLYRQMMINQGLLPDPNVPEDPMANLMALLPKEWQAANLAAQQGYLTPEQMAQFEASQARAQGFQPGTVDPLLLALGITGG